MKNVCVSFSLGKDSTLSLYRALKSNRNVVALVINVDKSSDRSFFHGATKDIIEKVSTSVNIPVVYAISSGHDYREKFIDALKSLNIEECVFGDIDIEDHKKWCSDVCKEAGIDAWFPLWQESRKSIVTEFVDLGFKAIIKTISKKDGLDKSFLNKVLSYEVMDELEQSGVDVCGENGEYHTIVVDGPIFEFPIELIDTGMHESQYAYSVILELPNE